MPIDPSPPRPPSNHPHDDEIECTVLLRPLAERDHEARIQEIHGRETHTDPSFYADLQTLLTAHPADLDRLSQHVQSHGARVMSTQSVPGSMVVRGTRQKLDAAFGTPPRLVGSLLAALRSVGRRLDLHRGPVFSSGFGSGLGDGDPEDALITVPKLAEFYAFPEFTGARQKLGVLILGGGFDGSGLDTYFRCLGLNIPRWRVATVAGATNNPTPIAEIVEFLLAAGAGTQGPPAACVSGKPNGNQPTGGTVHGSDDADLNWTAEALMDVEYAGALANDAEIVVYVAPDDARGIWTAIRQAADDGVAALCGSFSSAESSYSEPERSSVEQALQYAALKGMTVCFSSGNHGSTMGSGDTLDVAYPASSPWVLGCGGTTVVSWREPAEVVWNEESFGTTMASGGGFSQVFSAPRWQSGHAFRGVPDISSNAAKSSGCWIWYGDGPVGVNTVGGGTSASAPLWAALTVLLNQALGIRLGFWNQRLYRAELERALWPISQGNNVVSNTTDHYHATGLGWNPCCGLGRPVGTALLDALGRVSPDSRGGRR